METEIGRDRDRWGGGERNRERVRGGGEEISEWKIVRNVRRTKYARGELEVCDMAP
jgi:hypothetical protein